MAKKRKHSDVEEDEEEPQSKKSNSQSCDITNAYPERTYEEKLTFMSPIANPVAPRKLNRRLLKLITKASNRKMLRMGIKDIPKFILKKKETGIVVIAGDLSPLDVLSHMPIVCEESDIAYCYTPTKRDIGAACGTRRSIAMVMIRQHTDYKELYDKVEKAVKALPLPIS